MKTKIKTTAVWLMIALYGILVMSFVEIRHDQVVCRKVNVMIVDSLEMRFVDRQEVMSRIVTGLGPVQGEKLEKINTKKIENQLHKHSAIKLAEAYKNVKGELCINIDQRDPIVRIMPEGDQGYYLDGEGYLIPLSESFSPHVPVITGHLPGIDPKQFASLQEFRTYKKDEKDQKARIKMITDLFDMALFMDQHEFWRSLIQQIYVNREGEIEMVPRIGSQLILFGDTNRLEDKFRNLKALYKKGLSKEGWIQYNTINLKYKNQAICSK